MPKRRRVVGLPKVRFEDSYAYINGKIVADMWAWARENRARMFRLRIYASYPNEQTGVTTIDEYETMLPEPFAQDRLSRQEARVIDTDVPDPMKPKTRKR